MSFRLTKITTRTGDDGSTGLGDGARVSKDAPRVQVLGEIDELNSALGLLLTEPMADGLHAALTAVQNDLFDLGGELSIPGHHMVNEGQVLRLDQALSELNSGLGPLREFILPGGTRAAALAHLARTVCRRAERSLVALRRAEATDRTQTTVSTFALQYLNRLSDLLFVAARALNRDAGVGDVLWRRQA